MALCFRNGLLAALLLPMLLGEAAASPRRAERSHAPKASSAVTARKAAVPRKAADVRPRPAQAAAKTRSPPKLLPLVVVDAGHGGHDPGAIGPSGTTEKTITLATAQELARQLRQTRRYRVLLTRNKDQFVSLDRRAGIAAGKGVALMVSVHADASPSPQARGASVYVRSARSSAPQAVRLPARRGGSRAIARALSAPQPSLDRLQLAMVDSLGGDLSMLADPARHGRFHVLGASGTPSVLVEMGFISNRQDEALLRQHRHRAVISRAIRDAIDDYFAGRGASTGPRA